MLCKMVKSMTGYGKASAELASGKITIEIRTLNGKNADISLKSFFLPKDKELLMRQRIAQSLVRGSIDVYISFEASASESARQIDKSLVSEYFRQIKEIRELVGTDTTPGTVADSIAIASVLRFPEVIDSKKQDIIDEDNWPAVEAALDEALAQVNAYRSREGEALYADVVSRVDNIRSLSGQIEAFEGERIETVRARLMRSLEELSQKVDENRFNQEIIYYLEKFDINEEKVRLRQHCTYFMDTIDNEAEPGKKLGFIIQEMGREINTTGSKANHSGIQKLVVLMKDELEKIREQSLNIL